MSSDWHPLGGSGGIPSDMANNEFIGFRRLKTETITSIGMSAIYGRIFSVSHTMDISAGQTVAINFPMSTNTRFARIAVFTDTDVEVQLRDKESSGVFNGTLFPVNINLCSDVVSGVTPQIFTNATPEGEILDLGRNEIAPLAIGCAGETVSLILTRISSGSTSSVDISVQFEEGVEISSIASKQNFLQAATQLEPNTEMSQYV